MGIQAVVSVRKDGKMAMKIVMGCQGKFAGALAKAITDLGHVPNWVEAKELCRQQGVGCNDCLALIWPVDDGHAVLMDTTMFHPEGDEHMLYSSYATTFNDPNFNPRWEQGIADYVEIVDF